MKVKIDTNIENLEEYIEENVEKKVDSFRSFSLLFKYPDAFDFHSTLEYYKLRAIKGVEYITDDSYSRTFRLNDAYGYFELTHKKDKEVLHLNVMCNNPDSISFVYKKVCQMLDLDTDLKLIKKSLMRDRWLANRIRSIDMPSLPIAFDTFEHSIRAILGQQITIKAATTLTSRIVKESNIETNFKNGLDYFFPTPQELFKTNLENLGITKTRQQTILTFTEAIISNKVSLCPNQDFNSFHKDCVSLKGIGDWTAHYIAMRGLGMKDSFPALDLGIIKALTKGKKKPTKSEILKKAEKWKPYRAYATLCLWKLLD